VLLEHGTTATSVLQSQPALVTNSLLQTPALLHDSKLMPPPLPMLSVTPVLLVGLLMAAIVSRTV
jgi:hypothetical protein